MLDRKGKSKLKGKKFSKAKSKKALLGEVLKPVANLGGGRLLISRCLDLFNANGLHMGARRQSHSLKKGGDVSKMGNILGKRVNPGSMSREGYGEGKKPWLWWVGDESPTGIPYPI